ncbi:MAG: (Z)-2-((N-methylformamido)methylene)-5-hydroxybutyrolactone dehydrogenase [Azoarcus sp.]|uniref:Aldehyde dehydrogenase (NAD+) n=1 Tax=Aromatoleum tolulyticum TaxID=34027 RepID=A0A1N6U4I5_9RHOO|nr:aldehyde dehydrogenase [Aromatoleum tolulyticum]MCK9983653.1 (Z)-2-((N-methylformamido)methylene)-5-hydroxybutyrolactone dehydrogenase [Azoarcus sp.]SIQ60236.1 aldehyde dehydrogenase (NAD+) [Aromatoleum tolulyticum]
MSNLDSLPKYGQYINGAEVPPASGEYFPTENPYSGEAWALIGRGGKADADAAVAAAHAAFEQGEWPSLTASQRGKLMRKLADLIVANAEHLAEIERRDNGKLAAEVVAQVKYLGDYFHYYAGLADKIESHVIPTDKKGVFCYTKYEAKGVVVIITPWNSPLTLTSWKLAPALAAGCTVVIKPSEFTSASAIEFAKLFAQAGFPPGVVNVVTGFGHEVGAPLVEHPDTAHIGFTGGEIAGQKIYEAAARGLKTVTLELGGKSPNIVFDDADLDQAVKGIVSGVFAASGQTCQAGSRLLVQESIHDEVVRRLVEFVSTAKIGDPSQLDTQVGPIATRPQFDKIMSYIQIAKDEGAKCVLGGKSRPDLGAGQFVEPTIFTGVNNKMRIAQEEVFGPVLCVIPFKDEEDAVRIGNDVLYGLAGAVWTKSLHRAMYVTDKLKAGTVWVNNYRATSFTSPFGGYKRSGIGRESGADAIKEYLETKCVWISTDLDVPNPFIRR